MGCCGVTYEEDIENDISDYLKTLNISDELKITLLKEVKEDLKKKSSTDNNFNPSRHINVEKTVNYYKNYINMRLKDNKYPNINLEKEIKVDNNAIENKYEINNNKEKDIKNQKEDDINNSINTEIKDYRDDKNEAQKEKEIKEIENKDNKVTNEVKEESKDHKIVKEDPKDNKN